MGQKEYTNIAVVELYIISNKMFKEKHDLRGMNKRLICNRTFFGSRIWKIGKTNRHYP